MTCIAIRDLILAAYGTFANGPMPQKLLEAAAADVERTAPTLSTALREKLGLKLTAARGPVEVLVVDHVERPTAN